MVEGQEGNKDTIGQQLGLPSVSPVYYPTKYIVSLFSLLRLSKIESLYTEMY